MAEQENYKITIKGPGLAFDRPVNEVTVNRIISFVMTGSALAQANGSVLGGAAGPGPAAGASIAANLSGLNPKQFIAQKKPQTQYERIACLAFYLTHFRNTPQFVTEDVTNLNTEAAQITIKNPAQIMKDTVSKYRFVTAAGDRNKQITSLGEAVVQALPNREAMKAAIAEHRPAKRKKRTAKKTK